MVMWSVFLVLCCTLSKVGADCSFRCLYSLVRWVLVVRLVAEIGTMWFVWLRWW